MLIHNDGALSSIRRNLLTGRCVPDGYDKVRVWIEKSDVLFSI